MYEDYDFLTVEQSDLDKFESVVAEDDAAIQVSLKTITKETKMQYMSVFSALSLYIVNA